MADSIGYTNTRLHSFITGFVMAALAFCWDQTSALAKPSLGACICAHVGWVACWGGGGGSLGCLLMRGAVIQGTS